MVGDKRWERGTLKGGSYLDENSNPVWQILREEEWVILSTQRQKQDLIRASHS